MQAIKDKVITKRAPGRPRKEDAIRTVVAVALSPSMAERLADWMKKNGITSKSEAGRILIERGLPPARRSAKRRMDEPR